MSKKILKEIACDQCSNRLELQRLGNGVSTQIYKDYIIITGVVEVRAKLCKTILLNTKGSTLVLCSPSCLSVMIDKKMKIENNRA